MRGIFLTLVYLFTLILGFRAPFILILGYVWVDIFTPQALAYTILPSIPVSLILGASALLMYFTLPADKEIKLRSASQFTIVFGFWMTLTLLWAEVPEPAFEKWNWAIKSVMFSCLIPLFLRTRTHIEAFIWTIVISGIAHCLPFGSKVLLSGGGYGMQLGLVSVNHGYGEGSTLAMFAVSLIPMCLYLYKWQTLVPYPRLTKLMLAVFSVFALLTSIGTYARTGFVSVGVLGVLLLLTTKKKFTYLFILFASAILISSVTGDIWESRMSTINDGTEGSAMGRVAAWLWTLKYVATHPLGGSFDVYRINEFSMILADGSALSIKAKAFHSIYFEILGEMGIPGFILFLLILFATWNTYRILKNRTYSVGSLWIKDISASLLMTLYIYLAGGAFIGIAFQSYFYYLAALSVALLNISERKQAA